MPSALAKKLAVACTASEILHSGDTLVRVPAKTYWAKKMHVYRWRCRPHVDREVTSPMSTESSSKATCISCIA